MKSVNGRSEPHVMKESAQTPHPFTRILAKTRRGAAFTVYSFRRLCVGFRIEPFFL